MSNPANDYEISIFTVGADSTSYRAHAHAETEACNTEKVLTEPGYYRRKGADHETAES